MSDGIEYLGAGAVPEDKYDDEGAFSETAEAMEASSARADDYGVLVLEQPFSDAGPGQVAGRNDSDTAPNWPCCAPGTIHAEMIDRETFDFIKKKHGAYASWAVWAEPTGGPKSSIGDLSVLDPARNSTLLRRLRNDVVMVGLNLSRFQPASLANFHDPSSVAQDYKIRFAFSGTPYYGAYMTDLVKGVVMLESSNLMRHLAENPPLVTDNIHRLLEEFDDLNCAAPTLIAFGNDAYLLAAKHVPLSRYKRLVRVTHYSHYISKEEYRHRVLAQLAA